MLRGTLTVCCTMLLCACMIFFQIGSLSVDTYRLYRIACALQSDSCAVFLLGNAIALFLQDAHGR